MGNFCGLFQKKTLSKDSKKISRYSVTGRPI